MTTCITSHSGPSGVSQVCYLLNVAQVTVDSHERQVVLGLLIVAQSRLHIGLALEVLGPPLVQVSVQSQDRNRHFITTSLKHSHQSLPQVLKRNSLVLCLVDVDLQGKGVIDEHSGNLHAVRVRLLITGHRWTDNEQAG